MKLLMPWLRRLLASASFLVAAHAQALCIPVACSCSTTVTNAVFSSYNPLTSGNLDTAGNIRVGCGGVAGLLIPYTIALSAGNSNDFSNRKLLKGAAPLAYNVYTSSAYTTVWGDGTGATQTVGSSITLNVAGIGPVNDHGVYARIFGGQTMAIPGAYSDSLTVTLTYY